MNRDQPVPAEPESEPGNPRGQLLRVIALGGWGLVLAVQVGQYLHSPTTANFIVTVGLAALFFLFLAHAIFMHVVQRRHWHRVAARLQGAAYLSEVHNLPNRNYVLSELRREMPRARLHQSPFVLIQLSIENIDDIRRRRGEDFARRSVNALAEVLKRLTRSSDFLAHLGGARFCVMLVDCSLEQSFIYLKRVPGTLSVSDGHNVLDVPVTARIHQYDLEALYATDVLRDLEESRPLRRREEPRPDALVA
ncbi:diguanylate cyclase domain-containing protein [Tepidiforma sp.]|uniref:diguanylate cyclase domain-containing protein n=1 Tax=Tepidiforma sp. TaxID=2682230 RepID=UPI002ADDE3C0|nr:diguanylate cyclase [Tepidiforma sp.]